MTAHTMQVTVDSADPHAQARFWAEALGWEVERHTEMIQSLLDQGVATDDDVIEAADGLARLTMLGARELYRIDEPGAFHPTMADPEGNEFCVQ